MSDKDSDSGTSTSQGKKPTNGNNIVNSVGAIVNIAAPVTPSKDKEPRKRGRRPKDSKDVPM